MTKYQKLINFSQYSTSHFRQNPYNHVSTYTGNEQNILSSVMYKHTQGFNAAQQHLYFW